MLNIKTSDPYNLKPVELTPAELDSVAGGNPAVLSAAAALAVIAVINAARKANQENIKSAGPG